MRLPVLPNISTKDGTSNKNSRLVNVLADIGSKNIAQVRPGLVANDTYSGLGSGLTVFDGRLLLAYGDVIYGDGLDSYPWDLDSDPWASGTTYTYGDSVLYLGSLWFSTAGSNTGNTPGAGSAYWATSYEMPEWDSGTTYALGDPVTYGGVTYYSMGPSNTGNNPSSTPMWSTSAPGVSRYRGYVTPLGLTGAGNPGAECASPDAAAFSAYSTATAMISCATKFWMTWLWYTYVGVVYRPGFGYFIRLNQWVDASPGDCSGLPVDFGIIDGGTVQQTV